MAFNFGGGASSSSSSSSADGNKAPAFSFGGNSTAAAPSFSFGGAPAPSTTNTSSSTSGSTGGFSFGGTPAAAAAATGNAFSFGGTASSSAAAPAPSAAPSFGSFGATASDSKSTAPSFGGFGAAGDEKATAAPSTTAPSFGSFGASTNAAPGAFAFGSNAPSEKAAPATNDAPQAPPAFGAAPATGTAFSFGGSGDAAAAAAPLSERNESVSFGASAETSATEKAAPGTFSFGGSDSGAPSQSNKRASFGNDEDSVPVGVSTPASKSTTTFPAASTPTAPPPVSTPAKVDATPRKTATEPPRLDYQTLTVEQIINKFQKELEQDAIAFLEEARRVAEYDAILRDSQRNIVKLTQLAHHTLIGQQELEQMLNGIDAFQRELETTLNTVEQHVEDLFQAQSHHLPADADMEREKAYATASAVEQRLQELSESLQTVLGEMDATQQRVLTGDTGKIVQILSQHEKSLADLETAARRMELDVGHVSKLLERR
ncbi:nuclear pore complex protein Nup62 [Fistulifera solaris]|uniref:Nuclear pore complex protein Nup62 n=1 Tax=Fistulifera solaris TaxID=1519565 RepID=A0A1Z5JCV3_FISSO|nr:nuclear pore complex protein Nup62 [Fistulifera solaris]|eukprot:GAX11591.1 nuclear pore complex protein Nup62 [Fistulifera solaris]